MFNRKHLLLVFAFCILIEQIYADTRLAYSKKEGVEIFTHSPQWCDTEVQLRYKVDTVGKLNNENLQSLTNRLSKLVENKCPQAKTLEILAGISLDSPSYTAVAQKNSGWKLIQSENTASEQIAGYSSYVPEDVKHIVSGNHPELGGTWYGELTCKRGYSMERHGLRLILNKSDKGGFKGVLNIFQYYGYYPAFLEVNGENNKNEISIRPVSWIKESKNNIPPITISGSLLDDTKIIDGVVSGWPGCETIKLRKYRHPEQFTVKTGLLFKAASEPIDEADCLRFTRWLLQNKSIEIYKPANYFGSNLIDVEQMRKLLGYSFFEWGHEARERYESLVSQCRTLRKGSVNSEFASAFDQIRGWWPVPLENTINKTNIDHQLVNYVFTAWQMLANLEANKLLTNQQHQDISFDNDLESLKKIDEQKEQIVSIKSNEANLFDPITLLKKEDITNHANFLENKHQEISLKLIEETIRQFSLFEKTEKGLTEFEDYASKTRKQLKQQVSDHSFKQLLNAYYEEKANREKELQKPRLMKFLAELNALKNTNISNYSEFERIDKSVLELKSDADFSDNELIDFFKNYEEQAAQIKISILENSADIFEKQLNELPFINEKFNLIQTISKKYTGTEFSQLSNQKYPKLFKAFSEVVINSLIERQKYFKYTELDLNNLFEFEENKESFDGLIKSNRLYEVNDFSKLIDNINTSYFSTKDTFFDDLVGQIDKHLDDLPTFHTKLEFLRRAVYRVNGTSIEGIADAHERFKKKMVQLQAEFKNKLENEICLPFIEKVELNRKQRDLKVFVDKEIISLNQFICNAGLNGTKIHSIEAVEDESADYLIKLSRELKQGVLEFLLVRNVEAIAGKIGLVGNAFGDAINQESIGVSDWQKLSTEFVINKPILEVFPLNEEANRLVNRSLNKMGFFSLQLAGVSFDMSKQEIKSVLTDWLNNESYNEIQCMFDYLNVDFECGVKNGSANNHKEETYTGKIYVQGGNYKTKDDQYFMVEYAFPPNQDKPVYVINDRSFPPGSRLNYAQFKNKITELYGEPGEINETEKSISWRWYYNDRNLKITHPSEQEKLCGSWFFASGFEDDWIKENFGWTSYLNEECQNQAILIRVLLEGEDIKRVTTSMTNYKTAMNYLDETLALAEEFRINYQSQPISGVYGGEDCAYSKLEFQADSTVYMMGDVFGVEVKGIGNYKQEQNKIIVEADGKSIVFIRKGDSLDGGVAGICQKQ